MYTNNEKVRTQMAEKSKEEIVLRTKQLYELIAIDPKNREIYEAEVIETNIKLVSTVCGSHGQYNEDDFQTGCIGLIMAAKTFNPDKGVPFANYACFLIQRELHAAFQSKSSTFEHQYTGTFVSLDDVMNMDGGDSVNIAERIADDLAEFDFAKCLDDFQLAQIFAEVITPAIEKISQYRQEQATYDIDLWIKAEMNLILSLIELEATNLNFTQLGKMVGLSTKNVRMKHLRVIEAIKAEFIARGYVGGNL